MTDSGEFTAEDWQGLADYARSLLPSSKSENSRLLVAQIADYYDTLARDEYRKRKPVLRLV